MKNNIGVISVSIVSHGHGALLPDLLLDLECCPEVGKVVVTRNIPEPALETERSELLTIIDNPHPKGFGTNHNSAFQQINTEYFAVLNPDIRLVSNPFPALLNDFECFDAALCAPAVVNPSGVLEDSARQFPSLFNLASKIFGRYDGRVHYAIGELPRSSPWVAGMFMLFSSADYESLQGFDESFYLYYEDVDICARLWKSGRKVMLCPEVYVIHDARRASRRNIRYMRLHATSMARYLIKHPRSSLYFLP